MHRISGLGVVVACCLFSTQFYHSFLIPKSLALLVCAVVAWSCLPKARDPGSVAVAWWLLWPLVTVVHVVDWRRAWVPGVLVVLVLCLFLLRLNPSIRHRRRWRTWLMWVGLCGAIYGLIQRLGLDPIHWDMSRQALGFMGNAGDNAHLMLLALCLGRYPRGWPGYLLQVLLVLGIVATESRIAGFGVILFWVMRTCARWWKLGGMALLVVAAACGLYLTTPDLSDPRGYVSRFERQSSLIAERDARFRGKYAGTMTRLILYANTMQMLGEAPLAGVGLGQFGVHYPRYASAWVTDPNLNANYRVQHAHNLVLELAIEFGIPWCVGSLALLAWFVLRMRHVPYRRALLLQLMIAGVSLNYLNPVVIFFLFWLRPPTRRRKHSRPPRWVMPAVAVGCGVMLLCAGMDVAHRQATKADPRDFWLQWFPWEQGRVAYREGRFELAGRAFAKALSHDPYGPDTLFGFGLASIERAGDPGDPCARLGLQALLVLNRAYPFHQPGRDTLEQLAERPDWRHLMGQAAAMESTSLERLATWVQGDNGCDFTVGR